MRRGVPCCGRERIKCNPLAEKLQHLWDRTIGSIVRINNISPDGDGDFTIEAGENIRITEQGTGNGIRIDTTGGVSYYSAVEDSGITVDNVNLKIGTDGLAKQSDLTTVANAALQNREDIDDILDGTKSAARATNADSALSATDAVNAQYLGSSTNNVGGDTKPVKIVNGEPVIVENDLALDSNVVHKAGDTMTGILRFDRPMPTSPIQIRATNQQLGNSIDIWGIQFYDANNNQLGLLYVHADPNGQVTLKAALRNSDGTLHYTTIA